MKNFKDWNLVIPEKYDFTYEDLEKIGHTYGKSFYIFDEQRLIRNIRAVKEKLAGSAQLCFSMKSNPWLIRYVQREVDCLEVCSPGELKRCIEAGIRGDQIVLDGVMKTEKEIHAAIEKAVERVSVDSVRQFGMIQRIAQKMKRTVKVILRLTNGNQFGMDVEEIIQLVTNKHPYIDIMGLHYYSGTQKRNSSEIIKDFENLSIQTADIEKRTGVKFEILEIGGGAGVPYFMEDDRTRYEESWEVICGEIRKLSEKYCIVYEAGRILTATAGVYISKVMDYKIRGKRKLLLLDGGMHHFTYYGQIAGRKTPYIESVSMDKSDELEEVVICGSLCTAQDILVRKARIKGAKEGTYIIFYMVGAYSVTESCMDFLSRSRPALLLKNSDQLTLLAKDGELDC